jgi:hypothetical protein
MGHYQPPHLSVSNSVYGIFYLHLKFFCVLSNVSRIHGVCVYRRLPQPGFVWMMKNWIYAHDTTPELDSAKQVFQGVHLQMCGEVLRCLGSDISVHIWTSPRSYAQRRLLQHFLHAASNHVSLILDPVK